MSAYVRQYKAPYRYARKGRTLVLLERGVATKQTFSSEAEAKRTVLEMNNAWRAQQGRKANPRPPMRRNFFGIFKSKPPLYRVTAYNRDGSTDVHTSPSHEALEIALDEAGIKERAIPGLMAAAEQRPLVDSSGDVFKRLKDAYGWYRVTIELVGERPQAKSNPRRNPSDPRAQVLHLLSTATVGEGRELEAFAERLASGAALSASDIEDATVAAEARLEDAEYEARTNRIAEYRAGLRAERDHYRKVLKAIKTLKPSRANNPRKRS